MPLASGIGKSIDGRSNKDSFELELSKVWLDFGMLAAVRDFLLTLVAESLLEKGLASSSASSTLMVG